MFSKQKPFQIHDDFVKILILSPSAIQPLPAFYHTAIRPLPFLSSSAIRSYSRKSENRIICIYYSQFISIPFATENIICNDKFEIYSKTVR